MKMMEGDEKEKEKFKNKESLFTYGTKSGNQIHGLRGPQKVRKGGSY